MDLLCRNLLAICLLLLSVSQLHAFISEQEPNNRMEDANLVACGDTVHCATLWPETDSDYFRVTLWTNDSLVLYTRPCNGSDCNTLLALYNTDHTLIVADDDTGPLDFSQIRFRAPTDGDYIVRVLRQLAVIDSTYDLSIGCRSYVAEDYDLCPTARVIPAFPYFDEYGSTRGATSQCGTASPDVFYRFHNPAVSNLFISVCTGEFNARMQVLGGCCQGFLDDADEGCGLGAVMTVFELPAGDYNVMVEGTSVNAVGAFSLEIEAQLPGCPAPGPVVLTTVGGYPFLDWPQVTGPSHFIVWQTSSLAAPWEHIGATPLTFFTDSSGYNASRRFYMVTSACPW